MVDVDVKAGNFELEFNAISQTGSVFLYRITTDAYKSTIKMIILKYLIEIK
jgi:hypothetical protein